MELDDLIIKMIQVHDNHGFPQPYQHVYEFVKNNQSMKGADFKAARDAIHDILDAKGVNFAILMYPHGTYVFTQEVVDLNPVIIKLASGINFHGEVSEILGVSYLLDLNKRLGRDRTE